MKNNNYRLIRLMCIFVTLQCQGMEKPAQPQMPGQSQQGSRPIPIFKLSKPQQTKYNLKIPVVGTGKEVDEEIDLAKTDDIVAYSNLDEIRAERLQENRDFIIARAATQADDKYFVEYYEMPNLNKSLFNGNIVAPANHNQIKRYDFLTPKRAEIIGEINYFIFDPETNQFNHFATDLDFVKIQKLFEKNQFRITNLPDKLKLIYDTSGANYYPTADNTYNLASYYLEKKDFKKSIRYFLRSAELNDVRAMVAVVTFLAGLHPDIIAVIPPKKNAALSFAKRAIQHPDFKKKISLSDRKQLQEIIDTLTLLSKKRPTEIIENPIEKKTKKEDELQ